MTQVSNNTTIHRRPKDGINGTSPLLFDLDNEMDSVACDKDGKASSATTITTHGRLYKGTTLITDATQPTATDMKIGGVTPTVTYTGGVLTVQWVFASGTALSEKSTASVKLTYGGVDYAQVFTLNGVRAGQTGGNGNDAVIYSLVPSYNSIKVDNSGTYTPAAITVGVTKTVGTSTTSQAVTSGTSGLCMYYSIDDAKTWKRFYTTDSIDVSSVKRNIRLRLQSSESQVETPTLAVIYDKETIPVVEDGQTGDNAVSMSLSADSVTIPVENNASKTDVVVSDNAEARSINVYVVDGQNAVDGSRYRLFFSCADETNFSVSKGSSYILVTPTAGTAWTGDKTITVSVTYKSKTYTRTICVSGVMQGDKGDKGDPGTGISIKGYALEKYATHTAYTRATKATGKFLVNTRLNNYATQKGAFVYTYDSSTNTTTIESADEGDTYLLQSDGHIYVAQPFDAFGTLTWYDFGYFKGEQGEQGIQGVRGYQGLSVRRSEWEEGVYYRNDSADGAQDADGNRYLDEVSITDLATGTADWYVAKALHNGNLSAANNKPTGNGNDYWTKMNDMSPIKTSYADIQTAFIQFLNLTQLVLKQGDGTVYGAFGAATDLNPYPLWFGGVDPAHAVTWFKKDGSASLAKGNLTYNANGDVTGKDCTFNGGTFNNIQVSGRGSFEGFVFQVVNHITAQNYEQYLTYDSANDWYEIDLTKIGNLMYFDYSGSSNAPWILYLPCIPPNVVVNTTTKDAARSMVGQRLIMYNNGNGLLGISSFCPANGDPSKGSTSWTIAKGQMVILECKVCIYSGKECIYWTKEIGQFA